MSSHGLPVPPTELLILMEGFRCPRDAAEGVRGFLPHSRGAEGLGRMEEGGRVTGPPAHWEGTEIGAGADGKGWDERKERDGDVGSRLGMQQTERSLPYFFWVPKPLLPP